MLPALGVAVLLLPLTGCRVKDTSGNTTNGKALFVSKCGSCHVLRRAGTSGTTGPNLDAAFAQDRKDGIPSDTIRGLVNAQIIHPNRLGVMPAKLVKGDDAYDVASYVARVAAQPGKDTGALATAGIPQGGPPGLQVFGSAGCASCHTLKAANASGTTGPNLDTSLQGKSADYIRQSIVDPNADIAKGYPANVMPSTFGKSLSDQQIQQLVDLLGAQKK